MGSCNCISRNNQNDSTLDTEKYKDLGKIKLNWIVIN
jgi:hypothetical protein